MKRLWDETRSAGFFGAKGTDRLTTAECTTAVPPSVPWGDQPTCDGRRSPAPLPELQR